MTALPIPARADEITAEWLTAALTERGYLDGARVASLNVEDIGLGTGYVCVVLRLTPHYEGAAPRAPASLIAKVPTPVESQRATAVALGLYTTEIRFFDELASATSMRVPGCYWTGMDQDAGRFALLLEDLAPARVGDQLAGCTVAEAELAVRSLANHHAEWWESPQLAEVDWITRWTEPEMLELLQAMFLGFWSPALERMDDGLRSSFGSIGEAIGQQLPALYQGATEAGATLMHGDYRLENMLFGEPGAASELSVIDWQIAGVGPGAYDLAYFVGQNLVSDMRREHERDLVGLYHETLTAGGVDGYSLADCWDDYRRSLLVATLIPLNGFGTLHEIEAQAEQADARDAPLIEAWLKSLVTLTEVMLDRNVAAILDTNAAELLQ